MKRIREHFERDRGSFILTWRRDSHAWQLLVLDRSSEPLTVFEWGQVDDDPGEVAEHHESFRGDAVTEDIALTNDELRRVGMPNHIVMQQMIKRLRVLVRSGTTRHNPGPARRTRAASLPPRGKRERFVVTESHDGWPVFHLAWWDTHHWYVLTATTTQRGPRADAWFEWGTVDPLSKPDIPEWDKIEGSANMAYDVLRVDPQSDAAQLRQMGMSNHLMLQKMIARLRERTRRTTRSNPTSRFETLHERVVTSSARRGYHLQDPSGRAIAAAIGRRKYGTKRFAEMAATGRRKR